MERQEFSKDTQCDALRRQGNRCGLCGESISALGEEGRSSHTYGETAQAHHMQHAKRGGSADVSNCIVLCQSCHYTAHEGGNYRYGSEMSTASDYPFFSG